MQNAQLASLLVSQERDQGRENDIPANSLPAQASDRVARLPKFRSWSCVSFARIGMIQNGLGLLNPIGEQCFTIFVVLIGNDGCCQQRRVDRAGASNRQRTNWNTGGHLYDGQER